MKVFFFLMTLVMITASCNQANKNKGIQVIDTESEMAVIEDEPINHVGVGEVSDFLSTYDMSSNPKEDNFALKGLEFGISESQYKNIEKNLLKSFEEKDVYGYHIGDFKFHHITPYFYADKLYRIDINAFNHHSISEIEKEIELVKAIFNKKYGNPLFEALTPPDRELSENTGVCLSEWKAGNKTIQLCFFDFSKAAHSNYLKLVIFRSDMVKSMEDSENQKKKEYSKANTDLI